ncbi:hypothetical protein [Acidianus sp. HS-5]|uniref:hypothetical protein n=1 Tax=Acidianus sp. HS-5 TaxID=2886040 RepID=UPI001F398653|nr:hypothetical protein [Acidianus sp. HS-5]BDC18852.1 hypothetical protein HS5_17420 [Acidianus sp. HS-5]
MRVKIDEAEDLVYKIFKKITYDEYAKYLSQEIADAEAEGHPDHGLQLIPYYIELTKGNTVDIGGEKVRPKAKVEIKGENFV